MRFRPHSFREEPEINFIPLIDVLLVILIFLIITLLALRGFFVARHIVLIR